MSDKREQILARLVEIAGTIPGITTVERNAGQLDELALPAIIVLDGDEAADGADPSQRPSNAPRRVAMTPEIYIMAGAQAEALGPAINALRALVIKAVLQDEPLAALTGGSERIRYEGCGTDLARGRTMQAEMGLAFTFSYILRAADL